MAAKKRAFPTLLLVVATVVWGVSFLITRHGVAAAPPLVFVAVRFATAALTLRVIARPQFARITRTEARGGAAIACAMLGGYGLQAIGMQTVESGRTAFITALYVPIVPLLQLFLSGRRPPARIWAGVALASTGLMLLAGPQHTNAVRPGELAGEAMVLGAAFSVACEILLIGRFAVRCDPRRLALMECCCLSVCCLALFGLSGGAWPAARAVWMVPAAGLGVASAFLQVSVNWAQRTVPAARATLIYALEPVWAGIAGALAGEHTTILQGGGAALILLSIVISTQAFSTQAVSTQAVSTGATSTGATSTGAISGAGPLP